MINYTIQLRDSIPSLKDTSLCTGGFSKRISIIVYIPFSIKLLEVQKENFKNCTSANRHFKDKMCLFEDVKIKDFSRHLAESKLHNNKPVIHKCLKSSKERKGYHNKTL